MDYAQRSRCNVLIKRKHHWTDRSFRFGPSEILRFLIADTKPAKAIDFNAGMELVKLADSYERQAARDFVEELSVEGLSRRQLVSIEDAQQALKYSVVNEGESYQNAHVTFSIYPCLLKLNLMMKIFGLVLHHLDRK